jgi:hypothetical protein
MRSKDNNDSRLIRRTSPRPLKEDLLLLSADMVGGQADRNFIYSIKSPFTKSVYKNRLKRYMDFRNINECEKLLEGGDPRLIQSPKRMI